MQVNPCKYPLTNHAVVDGTEAASTDQLAEFLAIELGTNDIRAAHTFLEEPLRTLLHLMLSLPEYQLG